MCHLSKKDQYVCQINQGIAEAVTGVLGGAQFPSCPFYHPRSSRCCLGHTREAAVCAGNFPDSNGISDDFKRQKRSHQTEPVPCHIIPGDLRSIALLVSRCEHPGSQQFFRDVLQGEAAALEALEPLATAVEMSPADRAAYEPAPGAQAYSAYLAWLCLYGSEAEVAAALSVNFAAWG